ncbi:hypothetical protein HDV02_004035 [Globomyces sp. JEL0801]|nr:hypothetical protein HDV02_004035 [Globomyces sp. JEL0801]
MASILPKIDNDQGNGMNLTRLHTSSQESIGPHHCGTRYPKKMFPASEVPPRYLLPSIRSIYLPPTKPTTAPNSFKLSRQTSRQTTPLEQPPIRVKNVEPINRIKIKPLRNLTGAYLTKKYVEPVYAKLVWPITNHEELRFKTRMNQNHGMQSQLQASSLLKEIYTTRQPIGLGGYVERWD